MCCNIPFCKGDIRETSKPCAVTNPFARALEGEQFRRGDQMQCVHFEIWTYPVNSVGTLEQDQGVRLTQTDQ